MSREDKITRADGAVWNTVKFQCPNCGGSKFEFHMIDDEQHFVMRCRGLKLIDERRSAYRDCVWQSERYTHLPSDAEAPEWPYDAPSNEVKTVEVLVPEDDSDTILEVTDFRGKDCDTDLPAMADAFEVTEER
jgi:hypothetical protein